MEDNGEHGTWQLIVHLHTDACQLHSCNFGRVYVRLPETSEAGPSSCVGVVTV